MRGRKMYSKRNDVRQNQNVTNFLRTHAIPESEIAEKRKKKTNQQPDFYRHQNPS